MKTVKKILNRSKLNAAPLFKKFVKSIWLFPVILTLAVIILCSLRLSGTSIGIYNTVFYGQGHKDSNLLLGKPQTIRSDEYSVSSLMAIAQSNNGYESINKNIGNGQDVNVLGDIPTNDWSTFFKPQNIGFLVLPFDNAFSLKWWLPGYFLILAAYFFVLRIMPKRKTLAILLSLSFILSPFLQWWYLGPTVETLTGALFGLLVILKIFESKKLSHTILWSLLLTYIGTSFIIIIYPPFQITTALVALAFIVGYLIKNKGILKEKTFKRNLLFIVGAIVISVATILLFLSQHQSAVQAITQSAYPGNRTASSGGASVDHLLSSNTSPLLQSGSRYKSLGKTNQSESSNFILIIPLLLIPAFYILYKERRAGKRHYIVIASLVVFALLLAWAIVPGIDLVGKLTLLDRVPANRALIGIGFANFILLVLFIELFRKSKVRFTNAQITIYSLLVVILYLVLNLYTAVKYPGFIGFNMGVALSLPFAVIVFAFLKRWYTLAVAGLLLFSIGSTFAIHPLYVGTDVVREATISQEIRKLNRENPKTWVGDDNYLENFTLLNGARSLTATYYYPQLDLWKPLDTDGTQSDAYNRYAHVNFAFDRDAAVNIKANFYLRGEDIFYIITEACDPFMQKNNVGYLLTNKLFNEGEAPCATLKTTIDYPKLKTYIYELSFNNK